MGFSDTDLNPVEEQWLKRKMTIPQQDGSLFYPIEAKAKRFSPLEINFDSRCIDSVLLPFFIKKITI